MSKISLALLSLAFCCFQVESQPITFADTNIVWTVFNGKRVVAAFTPGDPFRGPRRYGRIPWTFNSKIPYGISYHYERNLLVFSDLSRYSIYTLNTETGSWNSSVLVAGFGWVEHTAVDWISDNLYWVDAYYEWIAMKSLDSTDITDYKVIADSSVISPRGITVDPNRGNLFWTDISDPPRIVRAKMDGTSQQVLAAQALINPFDLTLKPDNGQIFWADRARDTLETVMYDGSDRQVIYTSHQGQPVGLSYYRDHIFLADTNFDDVLVLDTKNGLGKTFFKLNQRVLGIARVITVWAKENQPDPNGWKGNCKAKQCEHYCLLDTNGQAQCNCQENFELQDDGKSCKQISKVPHHALVLTNGTHICAYHLTVLQGATAPKLECYAEGQSDTDIGSIAVDSQGKKVYYSTKVRSEIRALNIEDGTSSTFSTSVTSVGGMAFDYTENVLYWSDVSSNVVRKQASTSTTAGDVFFDNNLGSIAIDPYHRMLFYIKNGDTPSILKYYLEKTAGKGENLTFVHPIAPKRITYEEKSQTIVWSDRGKLQSVSYDGKVNPSVGTLNVHNMAITVYGKFLMWSTDQKNGTSLIHMYKPPDKSTYKRLRVNFPGVITDYGIFDRMRHDPNRDSCFTRNGGCDQICIHGVSVNKCRCEFGYLLQSDQKSCVTILVADNYTFATDPINKKVIQVDLTSGNVAATKIGEGTSVSNIVVINKTAYWADKTSRVIMKSKTDGTQRQPIFTTSRMMVQKIAVDPSNEHIYYTATNGIKGEIGVINKMGNRHKVLVTNVKLITDIKIHSRYGLMFWVERSTPGGIERATMAGRNRRMIIRATAGSQIYGIELDYETDMLYWCDKKESVVWKSGLFGFNPTKLFQDKEVSITDIAILGDYLYYTGTNRNGILARNKKEANDGFILMESPLVSQLHDLSVISNSLVKSINTNCAAGNAGCSSFCIPVNDSRSYTCACSDDDTLTDDGRQCAFDVHPDLTTKPLPSGFPFTQAPFVPTRPTSTSSQGTSSTTAATPPPGNSSQPAAGAQSAANSGPNAAAIAVPIVLIIVLAVVAVVGFLFYRRRQAKRSPLVSEPRGSENPSYFNNSSNVETVKT